MDREEAHRLLGLYVGATPDHIRAKFESMSAELRPVAQACARDVNPDEGVSYDNGASWNDWIDPFKRRVCTVITGDGKQTLEEIAEAHGVPRATMYRFNEQVVDSNLEGQTVYIPK